MESVLKLPSLFKNAGTVKLEIELEKTSKMVEIIAGATIGIVMRLKILNLLAFKIVAASSRLASMFLKMPPIKMYANGA